MSLMVPFLLKLFFFSIAPGTSWLIHRHAHQVLCTCQADAACRSLQTPYLHFIWHLKRAFPMRPIVMLECRHISLSLCTRAVTPDTVMEAVVEMLRRNRWHKAAFVAHSYGTFILSCIAQQHRDLVESMVGSCAFQLHLHSTYRPGMKTC